MALVGGERCYPLEKEYNVETGETKKAAWGGNDTLLARIREFEEIPS